MNKIHALISAAAIAAVTALPVFAQQTADYTTTQMGGETALDIAQRVGACGQSGISTATFDSDSLIRVTCRGGVAGAEGLSGGLAAGAAAGALALIALAADGSSSGTTTTTTTTTTD